MLLAITALLIVAWLIGVLILQVGSALVHVLILLAVMVYMLHPLRSGHRT